MNHRYFVGHRKPDFPLWDGFLFYELKQPSASASPLERLLADHRLLSEYAALFSLRKHLIQSGDADDGQITIAQYRRFVLNMPMGLKSSNLPWARVLSPDSIAELPIKEEVFPAANQRYLIGTGMHLPNGMLGNYAAAHYARDILRFTANLVDAKLMTNAQAYLFLSDPYLIPSPSCGSFPLPAFLNIIGKLEQAASHFFESGYQPYGDAHQGRVCGALIERYNSFLLLEQLANEGQNVQQVTGSTTLISDGLEVSRGMMAKEL